MKKLEELKAALEAATVADCDVEEMVHVDAVFITLAHNMMPTLLEAVELLNLVSAARARQDHDFDVTGWYERVRKLEEKLK